MVQVASRRGLNTPRRCPAPQIRGYPTLKVYYGGKAVDAYRGGRDFESLKAYVEVRRCWWCKTISSD